MNHITVADIDSPMRTEDAVEFHNVARFRVQFGGPLEGSDLHAEITRRHLNGDRL